MLVLSRGKDESIMVGDNVEIVVVDIRRNKIQLGIIAPKVVPVYRKEIYGRIRQERELARNERMPFHSRHRNALAAEA